MCHKIFKVYKKQVIMTISSIRNIDSVKDMIFSSTTGNISYISHCDIVSDNY